MDSYIPCQTNIHSGLSGGLQDGTIQNQLWLGSQNCVPTFCHVILAFVKSPRGGFHHMTNMNNCWESQEWLPMCCICKKLSVIWALLIICNTVYLVFHTEFWRHKQTYWNPATSYGKVEIVKGEIYYSCVNPGEPSNSCSDWKGFIIPSYLKCLARIPRLYTSPLNTLTFLNGTDWTFEGGFSLDA